MESLLKLIAPLNASLRAVLPWLQSVFLLYLRYYMAKAFFLSGLGKIKDWEITLLLFNDDFKVPLLPPTLAAVLGTGGELILPVLLMLGLFGRFGAAGLFVVNIVAAISLSSVAEAALKEHLYWGILLAVIALFGPGRIALDTWLKQHGIFKRLAID